MLSYLHIQNLAIADDVELSFGDGFNVMTGETGAGKSIVVDAVGLLSGGRAYRELIRTGCDRAVVEGMFTRLGADVARTLEELSLPVSAEITVKRIIQRDGPSRALVNGELVTQAQLQTLGRHLVEIHSQNDQQMLLAPENHLTFLDAFGRHRNKLDELTRHTETLKAAATAYRDLLMDEREKNQRIDMLRFQINEIRNADIQPDELERLTERKAFLRHAGKIRTALQLLEQHLTDGEEELNIRLGKIRQTVTELSELQPRFIPYREPLETLYLTMGELDREVAQAGLDMDEDGPDIEEVENRLVEIERIMRKYGEDHSGILAHLTRCQTELSTLEELEFQLKEHGETLVQAHHNWLTAAAALSKDRKAAGKRFGQALAAELKELAMPDVQVQYRVDAEPPASDTIPDILAYAHSLDGMDTAEIRISPNVGEELKPLVKVASGGEISRIMLAIKLLTGTEDETATAVFDEVDAGIGGNTAIALARRLKAVAGQRQVLCVTHLGQVAATGDIHFRVHKSVVEGRTRTVVESLTKEQRLEEIARMTGGREITEISLRHAAELIGGQDG